jgi:hypothetical protein
MRPPPRQKAPGRKGRERRSLRRQRRGARAREVDGQITPSKFAGHSVLCPYKCEERVGRMPALQGRRGTTEIEERFLDDLPGSTNRRPWSPTLRPGASRKGKDARLKSEAAATQATSKARDASLGMTAPRDRGGW